jgi:hypothetical protein
MKKKFTLVVETSCGRLPQWIYDGHLDGRIINGIRAETISNDDVVSRYYGMVEKYGGED